MIPVLVICKAMNISRAKVYCRYLRRLLVHFDKLSIFVLQICQLIYSYVANTLKATSYY